MLNCQHAPCTRNKIARVLRLPWTFTASYPRYRYSTTAPQKLALPFDSDSQSRFGTAVSPVAVSIRRLNLGLSRRQYATYASNLPVENVAVLGGGITGLASAHFLAKELPKAKITLYESREELGGWIKTNKVDVGNGEVLFEQGPRSLRPQAPNGTLTLRLVQELDLINELLITSKSAPAARNRFIYYPDHLVRMPAPGMAFWEILSTIIREPIFDGIVKAIHNDMTAPTRPDEITDESVGNFIKRRGDVRLANNLLSALYHGIYAGDIWQLSARSILPLPWRREKKNGSLSQAAMSGAFGRVSWNFCDDIELQVDLQNTDWNPDLRDQMLDCSVYTFKNGLGQLAKALESKLAKTSNVHILRDTMITKLEKDDHTSIKIMSKSTEEGATVSTSRFSHVVSTVSPTALTGMMSEKLRQSSNFSSHLEAIPAVTVCVVNMYFDTPYLLQKIKPPGGIPRGLAGLTGFGYLIPNSVPFIQNPERALGVIFDSDIAPDLWTSVPPANVGTRLTVMLGGHWWEGWKWFPSDDDAKELARSVLDRHLGIKEAPVAVSTTLQRNCIPQYMVGHEDSMSRAHQWLLDAFGGRLRVAGSWYTGVGVNDCLRAAWDVVQGLGRKSVSKHANPNLEGRTGLERFFWGRPMVLVKAVQPGTLEVVEIEDLGKRMGYFAGARVKARDDDR